MLKIELEKKNIEFKWRWLLLSFIFLFLIIIPLVFFATYNLLKTAPDNFPLGKIIEIKTGESPKKISKKLEEEGIIKSSKIFQLGKYKFPNKTLKAGKYSFQKPMDLWAVYSKLVEGDVVYDYVKFTILEGEPNYLISKKISRKMKNIEEDDFFVEAKKYEGKLYPDTYHLPLKADLKTVIKIFLANFDKKIKDNKINLTEENEKEVLIKASLVESEAGRASYETKRHVAGIIENRLKKDMKLQIDAVFSYIYKKHLYRVLHKHLKIDSKYNLYKYSGLPPTPISNPSIDSIRAVLNPMNTNDLYYITGNDGVFYYARTGSKHNQNVQKYLR